MISYEIKNLFEKAQKKLKTNFIKIKNINEMEGSIKIPILYY
jgi:hypothetical protein